MSSFTDNILPISQQLTLDSQSLNEIVDRTNLQMHLIFYLIIILSISSLVISVFINAFSATSWKYFALDIVNTQGENAQNQARIFWDIWVVYSLGGTFSFCILSLYFYRRWVRQSLKCTTHSKNPIGLAQANNEIFKMVKEIIKPYLSSGLGHIGILLNSRSVHSYVVSTEKMSWIVLNYKKLQKSFEQIRFTVLHEFAHIIHGDQRIIGWVKAIVKASLILYIFCLIPLTLIGVVTSDASLQEKIELIGGDIGFFLIILVQLWAFAEVFKQREVCADIRTIAWTGSTDILLFDDTKANTIYKRILNKISEIWRLLWGRIYHLSLESRKEISLNPKKNLAPLPSISIFAGFCTFFIGAWGFIIPPLSPIIMETPDFSLIFAITFHPWRLILFLTSVALVGIDLGKDINTWEKLGTRMFKVGWWFSIGGLVWLILSLVKGILGENIIIVLLSGLIFMIPTIIVYVLIFLVFITTLLLVSRPTFSVQNSTNVQYNFDWRLTFLPLFLYLGLWLINRDSFTQENFMEGFRLTILFFLLTPQFILIIGHILSRYKQRKRNLNHIISQSQKQTKILTKWNLATIIGGTISGIFVVAIPIHLWILNLDSTLLLGAYPKIRIFLIIGILTGFLAGSYRWLLANISHKKYLLLITLVFLFFIILYKPIIIFFFYSPAGIVIALYLADKWITAKPRFRRVRYRLLLCVICAAIIALTAGLIINTIIGLSGIEGFGELRDIGGETSRLPLALGIFIETIRGVSDSIINAFFIGLGIAMTESVFGSPKRETQETVILDDAIPIY